jgi:transcriptional regulator with XRE-family HTH domain
MNVDKSFGELVQLARKSRGWSQDRLAVELKISQVSVHRIENGEQPVTLARAVEISRLLEIPLEKIIQTTANDRLNNFIDAQPDEVRNYIRDLIAKNI